MIQNRLCCMKCRKMYEFDLIGKCSCGGTLLVQYDLEAVKRIWSRELLAGRPASMWKYCELLPVRHSEHIVTLGEGWTDLTDLTRFVPELKVRRVRVKREDRNPTGSFKARGLSCAVSLLHERNIRKAVLASNGNAASALAAYSSIAAIEAAVFLPADCPASVIRECNRYGAETHVIPGWIQDAGAAAEKHQSASDSFNLGTLREPGRIEGKKTIGFEIAEQSNWKLPSAIVYPTGGGSGLIGMWKAFQELLQLGIVQGDMPRFYAVQAAGCDPVVQTVHSRTRRSLFQPDTSVRHTGIRVPYPPDGQLPADIVHRTGGSAVSVTERETKSALRIFNHAQVPASHEGAAGLAGLLKLFESREFDPSDDIVLFNTAHSDNC